MLRAGMIAFCLFAAGSAFAQPEAVARDTEAYRRLSRQVEESSLSAAMAEIAGFGNRLSGSIGEKATLEFVESEFRRLGLANIRRETFSVTVPDPTARGRISGAGWSAELYPLWPNLVRTSTCDLEGPLVYGKSGTPADLRGLPLQGSVVVLEFGSRANWRNAIKLGARAVVFLEPDIMERTDAEQKFSSVPLSAPRFFLPRAQAASVLRAAFRAERVRLKCRQDWVVRPTYNLFADLPRFDKDVSDERIVLAAPADAMSIVPGLAPGASGASGIAALLELARLSMLNPGRRPITFGVVAANGLGLQGWREYAERRIREGKKSFLELTLDMNDGSSTLGAFSRSWYIDYRNETLDPVRSLTRTLRAHADRIAPVLGASSGRFLLLDPTNESDGRTWRNTIYAKFAFGCEPLTMAGMNAVTFGTVENSRERIDTPFDTFDRMRVDWIAKQVRTLACLMWHLSRDTSSLGELSGHKVPVNVRTPTRQTLVSGFATLEGQVVKFDPNKSFIADIPVPEALAVMQHVQKTLGGVRGSLVQYVAPKTAEYKFLGVPPSSNFWHLDPRIVSLGAYALDPASGRITVAPTERVLGFDRELTFQLVTTRKSMSIVVFDCVATDFYDLTDPQELRPFRRFAVFDPAADAAPESFSMALPAQDLRMSSDQEDSSVLFLPPGAKYKLLMGTSPGEWRLILVRATESAPTGSGYSAPSKEVGEEVFSQVALHTADDLVRLNGSRLDAFKKYRILSPGLDRLQEDARNALTEAEDARASKDWARYGREARAAWGYALRAHPMIAGTVNDVVNGVLFYLILLVPFSYFAERLFFARRSLTSQLGAAIGIFIAAFLVLRAIHPAFEIVSNPSMIFVAFVMGALSLLVAIFIVGKFESSLREMKAKQTGVGHLDVGRMSVAMAAFNLGIANMRRRKARTFLTTLTLVVMTFIVLSFTSIVPDLTIAEASSSNEARYSGLLVRNPSLDPMQNVMYRAVSTEFSGRATVVRRAWYFGADIADHGVLTVTSAERSADVRAVVGLDPGEARVTRPQEALLPGGRWFTAEDRNVTLLPFSVAEKLGIGPEDVGKASVEFGGQKLRVIGLLDEGRLRGTADLDGESILPADFSLSTKYQTESRSGNQAFRKFLRLDPGTTIVLPVDLTLALGGELRTVAVEFRNPEDTRKALESLMPRLRLNVYASVPGSAGELQVKQFSVLQSAKSAGLGLVLVQMLIASVFVLNTMVASVFERRREIGIFSSIGLAPNHIAVLFFAESCVYGVLGAVIGYFLAQGVARVVIQTGLMQGLYLNFSATSAVMAAAIVLSVVLLSTIFPARVAERIAAPAYESEIEEEPEGDHWRITLPFRVSAAEAEPLMNFFADWFRGHEDQAVGDFVTAETTLTREDATRLSLNCQAWLAPFDLGVSQTVQISSRPATIQDVVELELRLMRLAGEPDNWVNVNRRFLVSIRRHFLAWRTRPRRFRGTTQEAPKTA